MPSPARNNVSNLVDFSHSESTIKSYRWYLRKFHDWVDTQPSSVINDDVVARFLSEQFDAGYAPQHISLFAAALAWDAERCGVPSPVDRQCGLTLRAIRRLGARRGRGQACPLSFESFKFIMATATKQRALRTRNETPHHALERGMLDRVIVAALFLGGLRRADVAALLWSDVDLSAPDHVTLTITTSKTNQDGSVLDVRFINHHGAYAFHELRSVREQDSDSDRVVPLQANTIDIRFKACCNAAGLKGRYSSHSGRIGLASELSARGAPITEIARAGNWRSADMVIHYSKRASLKRGAVATYLND